MFWDLTGSECWIWPTQPEPCPPPPPHPFWLLIHNRDVCWLLGDA